MRKILFLALGLLLLSASSIYAQNVLLTVTSIGTIDTSDVLLSSYTYTSENPTINGTAEASSMVTIAIDDDSDSVTTNVAGVWTYKPTTLLDGQSYEVVIESGDESQSFSITISESGVSDADDTEPATLPDTGFADYTYLLGLLVIVGALASGYVVFTK